MQWTDNQQLKNCSKNANTDPSTYRLFGRGYYLRLTQNFE